MFLFLKKVLHSYLTPRFLFNKVIKNKDFDDLLKSSINQKKLGVINKHANPKTTDHEGNIVLLKDADSFHIPKDILSFNDWSFNGESLSYQLLIWFRNCLFAFIIVGLFIKNKKLS